MTEYVSIVRFDGRPPLEPAFRRFSSLIEVQEFATFHNLIYSDDRDALFPQFHVQYPDGSPLRADERERLMAVASTAENVARQIESINYMAPDKTHNERYVTHPDVARLQGRLTNKQYLKGIVALLECSSDLRALVRDKEYKPF